MTSNDDAKCVDAPHRQFVSTGRQNPHLLAGVLLPRGEKRRPKGGAPSQRQPQRRLLLLLLHQTTVEAEAVAVAPPRSRDRGKRRPGREPPAERSAAGQ